MTNIYILCVLLNLFLEPQKSATGLNILQCIVANLKVYEQCHL